MQGHKVERGDTGSGPAHSNIEQCNKVKTLISNITSSKYLWIYSPTSLGRAIHRQSSTQNNVGNPLASAEQCQVHAKLGKAWLRFAKLGVTGLKR